MKAMGVRKKDNDCCPYHAKYPVPGNGDKLSPRKRRSNAVPDKSRKAKVRQAPIDLDLD